MFDQGSSSSTSSGPGASAARARRAAAGRRELVRVAAAEAAEVDEREHGRHAGLPLARGRPKPTFSATVRCGKSGVVLEDHPDPAPLRRHPGAVSGDGPARDLDGAGLRALEARDQAQQRRLAAAGGAEEGDELAALDAELCVVHGLHGAEALRDPWQQIIPQPCKGTLHDRRGYGGSVLLAEVYPLVSSRSVARAFTYEVPDDVGVGAVVSIRFGRSAARGVVVETGVEAPAGVEPAPIDPSSTSCRLRSSSSRSGSRTTTARRRRARSSSSRRSCARGAASAAARAQAWPARPSPSS